MSLSMVAASSQYVNFGAPAGLDDITPVTRMAWVNLTSYGGGGFGRIFDKTHNIFFVCNTAPGNLASLGYIQDASGGQGFWCTPTNSLLTAGWHHVAVTYNPASPGTAPVMYIDGVSQTITTVTAASGTRTSDVTFTLFMGNWSSGVGREFDGLMEDARIYGRILTANEILSIYTAKGRDGGSLDNLVLRALCMDKGEAQNAAAGDPKDISNNNFTSALNNTPTYAASRLNPKRSH